MGASAFTKGQTMLWPLAVYFGAVVMVVAGMLLLSHLLGQRHCERATGEPFESGMPPTGSARLRFPSGFYLMALLFVIFDLETVLFLSWAIAIREAGWTGYLEILVVSVILMAALAYLWKAGALDWGSAGRKSRQ
jgi:NADH-quinone oxidoreductase subunit A